MARKREAASPRELAGLFGARLRELREAAGLSQQALADKAGMARIGIAQLEAGTRRPQWQSVIALAQSLGVPCDAFLPAPGPPHALPTRRPGRPRRGEAHPASNSRKR